MALFASCSCSQANERGIASASPSPGVVESLQANVENKEQERSAQRKKAEEDAMRAYADAYAKWFDGILSDALVAASKSSKKDKYTKKFEAVFTGTPPVRVEVSLGRHFTGANRHLIIRREGPGHGDWRTDIYSEVSGKFEKALSYAATSVGSESSVIRDINGDGLRDFVVSGGAPNGCCLKEFSVVYLLKNDRKSFSESVQFLNPTFSPKEKVVRTVSYGHPGEVSICKYRWNGEKADESDCVSYQKNDKGEKTGKVVISAPDGKIVRVVGSVPKEYRKIQGYDWFTGEGYEQH